MSGHRLSEREMELLRLLFGRRREIERVILFGSRAKGNARPNSDVDLAIVGIDGDLAIEALAEELEELPLPYRFDLKSRTAVRHRALREHMERVGVVIYER